MVGGINLFVYTSNNPINLIDPEGLRGIAIDTGGGLGIGDFKTKKSKADSAGSGFYIGAKENRQGYAELGAFTSRQKTKIGGAKIGLGFNFTIYYTDAEKFFQGTTPTKSYTFGPVTMTKSYDPCNGEEMATTISLWGIGGGLAYEEGKSEGQIHPLQ